jgi:hypothetical protein
MRGDCLVAQRPHEVGAVIALFGTERDRRRGIGVRRDQRQRRQPLGMA